MEKKEAGHSAWLRVRMRSRVSMKQRGITLIELLVGLVICGIGIAGIYRLFIAQGRAYSVQDQVAEVQQSIRTAMEIILRDIRMAGFDDDNPNSTITIANPVVYPVGDNSIAVNYEYYDKVALQFHRHTVAYWIDGTSRLMQQVTVDNTAGSPEALLENVAALNFSYGVDGVVGLTETQDGTMDDRNGNGMIDDNDWVSASTVNTGNLKVVSVRISLTARPEQINPDLQEVSPRTLVSAVTLRNLCLLR